MWCAESIGLGHLLLRVTGEDFVDAQPVHGPHHTVVADLRLDNREELAAKLSIPAARLLDMPDSALLLKAFERWGETCVDHLLGDFAFAAWDERTRQLTLARDPMGQRNVFFHHAKDAFVFATDMKGLWAVPGVPKELSDLEFAKAILMDAERYDGATKFEGVYGLTGGTVLGIDSGGTATSRRYWTPHADPAHLGKDEAYYIEAYRRVLTEAVACRIRRVTRPAGLLLGGGFDSGAIAGLAGPAMTAARRKLIAVSSVLPAGYAGPLRDVRRWTQMIARDMPHIDMRYVSREDFDLLSGIDAEFARREQPFGPNSMATSQMYDMLAAAGARVVMNGHGGDYTLNPRITGWLARILRRGQFRLFAREFRAYLRHHKVSLALAVRRELLRPAMPGIARPLKRALSGLPAFATSTPLAETYLRESLAAGARPRWRLPFTLRDTTTPRLMVQLRRQQDMAVMGGSEPAAAFGLELTQPYHDKRVVELALAIPETVQAREGRSRHLARRALADVYPREFEDRDARNDEMTPDMEILVERALPTMLQDIARMERNARLTRYFDFIKMRRLLAATGARKGFRGVAVRQGLHAFIFARYLEWLRRGNDPPPD